MMATALIDVSDAQIAVGYLAALATILVVALGGFDWVADRVNDRLDRAEWRRWAEALVAGRTADRDHIARFSALRDEIVDDLPTGRTVVTFPLRCEDGVHRDVVANRQGLPVCADCGALQVVELAERCRCGRGPIVVLQGNEACCAVCATENAAAIREALLRHPSSGGIRMEVAP